MRQLYCVDDRDMDGLLEWGHVYSVTVLWGQCVRVEGRFVCARSRFSEVDPCVGK